jgi:uncharacterized protein (DUF1786 family)
MKILTVDIGTGTQDIYLYDSQMDLENGYKLVLPSPTMLVNRRLKRATRRQQPVLLTGGIMGGGPSQWAAEAHLRAGLRLYATPAAARSFNDDLSVVEAMGIRLVSEDEAARLPDSFERLELRDFDFPVIQQAFALFDVSLSDLAAVAVAVFDHGDAPPQVSDRQFRFDYLDQRIRAANRLSAFAYLSGDIPPILTRLQSVADSAGSLDCPLVVMDTAPAAVLGATFDAQLACCERLLVANVGNFHTLAFRLSKAGIEGVFEHHTGLLDLPALEALLRTLADGSLLHADVFDHHGHGALIYEPHPLTLGTGSFDVAVTGPRRSLMRGGTLRAYYPAPFGDMMITGCFGLLAAVADLLPELSDPLRASLSGSGGSGTPPWEVDN